MRKVLLINIILLFAFKSQAQKSIYYLEDQIFIAPSYLTLVNTHDSISQGGLPNGLSIGYIRDIPLNKQRNIGFGLGINYSIVHYYHNISMRTTSTGNTLINRLENDQYVRNKFSLGYIEMPIEFRYRTSTIDKYKFFRAYLGFKLGYKIKQYSKLKTKITEIAYYDQPEFNDWRYGITLNIGYGSWNLHLDYDLSKILKDGTMANPVELGGEKIPMTMQGLAIGLIFYLI